MSDTSKISGPESSRTATGICVFGRTSIGDRPNNEDNFLVAELSSQRIGLGELPVDVKGALLVVSDGMGGAEAGEVASRIAVETLFSMLIEEWVNQPRESVPELENNLSQAFDVANQSVKTAASENAEMGGMGATLTATVVLPGTLVLAHTGDSRCYLLRDGELSQASTDQSLVAELIARGRLTEKEAVNHPQRNLVSQAIGLEEELRPEVLRQRLEDGDRVLLCTDGLTDLLSDEEIRSILLELEEPAESSRRLIEVALERASATDENADNVTVIVATYRGAGGKTDQPAEGDASTATPTGGFAVNPDERTVALHPSIPNRDGGDEEPAPRAPPKEGPGESETAESETPTLVLQRPAAQDLRGKATGARRPVQKTRRPEPGRGPAVLGTERTGSSQPGKPASSIRFLSLPEEDREAIGEIKSAVKIIQLQLWTLLGLMLAILLVLVIVLVLGPDGPTVGSP